MTVVLFGEAVGNRFERGVSQYPTVGDEAHIVTSDDLRIIYEPSGKGGTIAVGHIAASSGIPARLDIGRIVARHAAVVGSTGSGKSNTIAVILEAIATQGFSSSRVLVIDPHGEYASAVGERGYVFRIYADEGKGEKPLYVPFWALPFDELQAVTLGGLQPSAESAVREDVLSMKLAASHHLTNPPPTVAVTSDSPIPFNVKNLWFKLDDFERQTFTKSSGQDSTTLNAIQEAGDSETLKVNKYPPSTGYNTAPFKNSVKRNIERQLELMRNRLGDTMLRFLLSPGADFTPDADGKTKCDLDRLVSSWVGHERPITVLDVSGLPSEILGTVVGTLLRIIYDTLFWGADLPIGGKRQPLLIILEEAHLFLPEAKESGAKESAAHRIVSKIAKEGRKYGVGLVVVTQRPSEIESTVLSQCGTMIALRLTNTADRMKVQAALPDDLGSLTGLLPSLRTGEGLVVGEAMPIPSRIRFSKAANKPKGDDPEMPKAWQQQQRPDAALYGQAIANWRWQSSSAGVPAAGDKDSEKPRKRKKGND
ncbi:MAG: ATP-binding protein [Planctomycetota bacterium]